MNIIQSIAPSLSELREDQRFGDVAGLSTLFRAIQERISCYCEINEIEKERRIEIEYDFMRVFMNYAAWSNPNRWMLDHLEEDGAFGILLVGAYTCLVMLRSEGTVSGHS